MQIKLLVKRLFLFTTLFLLAISALAQEKKPAARKTEKDAKRQERRTKIDNLIRQQEEGALVYNKQNVFGLRVNTDGWSMFYEKGYLKSVKVTNLFSLELSEKKHPKEKKLSYGVDNGAFIQFSTPYVYGKQNIFYQVKPTFGQQRMIGGKANKNGVAVHAIYTGGISIGLERPYYLTVAVSQNQSRNLKYSVADSTVFLSPGNIIQGTGFRYGWRDMKVVPGLHGKFALRFDYGRFNEVVSAIEVGVNAEIYSRDINQMVNVQGFISPSRTFFNSYVAILFGKRK
jgi:hypothetical protein